MALGSLSTYLKSFDYENKLEELLTLIETCVPRISFWGERVLAAPHYSGSVSLEWLTRQVQNVARNKREIDTFTLPERIAGLEIVKKLKQFYVTTDEQLAFKCLLTRNFQWIREFSYSPFTTRFYLDLCIANDFRTFKQDKLERNFGPFSRSERFLEHPSCDGGNYLGWYVKEEILRQCVAQAETA